MLQIAGKFKPARGFSHAIHFALNGLLPVVAYVLVRIEFVSLAILLVVISKWRMFAVRPRYWLTNIVSNGIDIIVGVSFVLLMANTASEWWQLLWMAGYIAWLTILKPKSDVLLVSAQAMTGLLLGLSVFYLKFGDAPLAILMLGTWLIAYLSARHFLTSFEEPHSALLAHIWAYFAAALAFILGHWLLFYGSIAQIVILLATVGYSVAALYYLDATEKLNKLIKRQLVIIMVALLGLVVLLSEWSVAAG